jgi:hypothetical protein
MAFKGKIPEGKIIMHDDTKITTCKDGYERNWLEDLKLGTTSENVQSYHDNKTNRKRVRCKDDGLEFECANKAGIFYGIDGSHVYKVCNKKLKKTGGKYFEFI